jgi:hypothetical protein
VADEAAVAATAFVDTVPGAETAEAGGEVREGGRRRRRGRVVVIATSRARP